MKTKLTLLLAAILLAFTPFTTKAADTGQAAPDFTTTDVNGNAFKLSDHKGKIVVLEWTNPQCPFVKKHYDSGNMQKLQEGAIAKGVEWVTINSSAAGMEGHTTADEAKKIAADWKSAPTAAILDELGEIGKLYGASTTPHMFVINADGALVYQGGIDDNSSPDPATIATAKNYVTAALDDLAAGRAVAVSTSQPYGCAVKYGH